MIIKTSALWYHELLTKQQCELMFFVEPEIKQGDKLDFHSIEDPTEVIINDFYTALKVIPVIIHEKHGNYTFEIDGYKYDSHDHEIVHKLNGTHPYNAMFYHINPPFNHQKAQLVIIGQKALKYFNKRHPLQLKPIQTSLF